MKHLLLTLAILFAASGSSLLRADDVALMQVRFEQDKKLHPVVIEFYDAEAPATVENFKKLAKSKFYDYLAFHRVFPHTLVQTGDPISAKRARIKVGTGGPGYTLQPEIHRKHVLGAVAMGRLPDKLNPSRLSNGSQFFICLKPMPEYDGQYTVFGHVVSGLDTLDTLSSLSVDSNDYPMQRVIVKSLRIIPREQLPAAPVPGAPAPAKPAQSHWWQLKKPWWKIF